MVVVEWVGLVFGDVVVVFAYGVQELGDEIFGELRDGG